MEPAYPPFPMPWNLPFQLAEGSQTSKRISESGLGLMTPSTRQKAGRLGIGLKPGAVNSPAGRMPNRDRSIGQRHRSDGLSQEAEKALIEKANNRKIDFDTPRIVTQSSRPVGVGPCGSGLLACRRASARPLLHVFSGVVLIRVHSWPSFFPPLSPACDTFCGNSHNTRCFLRKNRCLFNPADVKFIFVSASAAISSAWKIRGIIPVQVRAIASGTLGGSDSPPIGARMEEALHSRLASDFDRPPRVLPSRINHLHIPFFESRPNMR